MRQEEQDKIYDMIGVRPSLEMHGIIKPKEGLLLKNFINEFKPFHVVETGSGVSTFFILKALQENGGGKLTSIDKYIIDEELEHQDGDFSKRREWIIPIIENHFSDVNWSFWEEDSIQFLESTKQMPIDLFFHDSYHAPKHIRNEWLLVKDRIKWFSSHNVLNLLTRDFFESDDFKREFSFIINYKQTGIWQKRLQ